MCLSMSPRSACVCFSWCLCVNRFIYTKVDVWINFFYDKIDFLGRIEDFLAKLRASLNVLLIENPLRPEYNAKMCLNLRGFRRVKVIVVHKRKFHLSDNFYDWVSKFCWLTRLGGKRVLLTPFSLLYSTCMPSVAIFLKFKWHLVE